MKTKFIYLFFIVFWGSISVFSQNCIYDVQHPSPISSYQGLLNLGLFAIDLNVDPNTKVKFSSAEFEITIFTYPNEIVNQGTLYLYEDNGNIPGNLISSFPVIPTSQLINSAGGSIPQYYYKITIPLNSFEYINNTNSIKKIWFAYNVKTQNNAHILQGTYSLTDGVPVKFYDPNTNLWSNLINGNNTEAIIKINKDCESINLSTSDFLTNQTYYFYPNPVKDILYYDNNYIFDIHFFSLNGEKINGKHINGGINMQGLPKGVYLVRYKNSKNELKTQKIVKE